MSDVSMLVPAETRHRPGIAQPKNHGKPDGDPGPATPGRAQPNLFERLLDKISRWFRLRLRPKNHGKPDGDPGPARRVVDRMRRRWKSPGTPADEPGPA